jgi:Cu/Ag efflux protein CusF
MKSILIIVVFCIFSHSASAYLRYQPAIAADSIVEGKIYHVKAEVKKKIPEQKKMIIKHERIKGLMEAMTMAFPVADSTIFDRCAIGSKGLFTLTIVKGFPVITAAHFAKLPKYVCPMHPDELSNIPGTCSICGMPFEKRK